MDIVDPRIDPSLVPAGSKPTIFAKDQPWYRQLPSIRTPDGQVITRWRLSDVERRAILKGEDLYLTISTFNAPLQPVLLTVGPVNWAGI